MSMYASTANTKANVLVVVLSCNKYRSLWQSILSKGVNNIIILVGSEGQPQHDQQCLEPHLEGQVLHLRCNDCYEGLPVKIAKAIDFVLKSPQFMHITHILKIDDHDTEFEKRNIDIIEGMLDAVPCDFMGQKLNVLPGMRTYHMPYVSPDSPWRTKWYQGEYTPWLHGGSSYVLSRRAMTVINSVYNASNIDQVYQNEIFEDVMVARILCQHDIHPKLVDYGIKGDRA